MNAKKRKKKVLIVFPTSWDAKQLDACRSAWDGTHEVELGVPSDVDCPAELDILEYIEKTVADRRGGIDGIMSSSDYPGATVAAAVSDALGLPGSRPETVLRCSHKYYSRLEQRAAVPEATAGFVLVDPADRSVADRIRFPCFIKPVKGAYSVMSRRLESAAELEEFVSRPAVGEFLHDYLDLFNRLVARYTDFEFNGSYLLAEDLLHGTQTTVEGFAVDGRVEILGVVDSIFQPGTGSFARFDYPSALPVEVQDRMADIARRVIGHLGLERTLFNIEMIYEPVGESVHIIEINPRICGQFADLYEKVDGTSGYEIALALATGESPALRRGEGAHAMATSFPLRVFEPCRVVSAPDEETVQRVESTVPGTRVWVEVEPGQVLADFERFEDGHSHRYAVVNLGAASRQEMVTRLEDVQRMLGFEFRSV